MRAKKERQVNNRLYASAETLAGMLDCGRNTATKIGTAAGARIQYGGKLVRFNVQKVEAYLNAMSNEERKGYTL